MGKVLMAILLLFLLFGVFRESIFDGIKGLRTEDTTEGFAVSTGAGQTTANVTLNSDLFQDDVAEVISITSNITGESPVATSYTEATNVLLVSALNSSATHTLTVNYYADTEDTVMKAAGPFFGILFFGFIGFRILYGLKKR